MEVPGQGLVHIRTVIKWLTDGVKNVSADRSLRVQQEGGGEAEARPRDLHVEEWLVGIGDDIACRLIKPSGQAEATLGRILRMRKKSPSEDGSTTAAQ